MIDPQLLKSTIKVCMFDQYGTVVDMQTGLVEAATPVLKAKNWPGNPNSFVIWWRRTHFENSMIDALLGEEHTPYREIGERAVAFVMDRAGISHTPDEVHALVAAIERLKPFSEVPTALDRLRTRYKLAVLSNGDHDMLETARHYHGVAFDRIISVTLANVRKTASGARWRRQGRGPHPAYGKCRHGPSRRRRRARRSRDRAYALCRARRRSSNSRNACGATR